MFNFFGSYNKNLLKNHKNQFILNLHLTVNGAKKKRKER